jgi:hypothetical protein
MTFDTNTFERLSGLELANYVVKVIKHEVVENDFLPYFCEKMTGMDVGHLELALGILAKIKSPAAIWRIADFLEHEDFNVRFVATKIIARCTIIDEHLMGQIVNSLRIHEGENSAIANELFGLLDRPLNSEALKIAQNYRFKDNK